MCWVPFPALRGAFLAKEQCLKNANPLGEKTADRRVMRRTPEQYVDPADDCARRQAHRRATRRIAIATTALVIGSIEHGGIPPVVLERVRLPLCPVDRLSI